MEHQTQKKPPAHRRPLLPRSSLPSSWRVTRRRLRRRTQSRHRMRRKRRRKGRRTTRSPRKKPNASYDLVDRVSHLFIRLLAVAAAAACHHSGHAAAGEMAGGGPARGKATAAQQGEGRQRSGGWDSAVYGGSVPSRGGRGDARKMSFNFGYQWVLGN